MLLFLCSLMLHGLSPEDLEGRQWVMTPDSRPELRIYLRLNEGGQCTLLYLNPEQPEEGKTVEEEWYIIPRGKKGVPQRLVLQDYMGEFSTFALPPDSSDMPSGPVIEGLQGTFYEVEGSEFQEVYERLNP